MLSLLLLPLVTAIPKPWDTIRLMNSCKTDLTIGTMGYSNGAAPVPVAAGATEFVHLSQFDGFVYAMSNSKSQWGMPGATKASLNFKARETGKYYILKDGFNVGIRISPPAATSAGCEIIECGDAKCAEASAEWLADGTHACNALGDWTVEFCPAIKEPESKGVAIHFNGDKKLCLDVKGNIQADGTSVQLYECNGSGAQQWEISRGETAVRLAGTNYCLDAGGTNKVESVLTPDSTSGTGMKIWTCYSGLPAQTMWYTDDNRLAVKDTGRCMTLPRGNTQNGVVPQVQACTDANPNQAWY